MKSGVLTNVLEGLPKRNKKGSVTWPGNVLIIPHITIKGINYFENTH